MLPCEAGSANFFIDPFGDVCPCNGRARITKKIPCFSPFRRKQGILSGLSVMEHLVLGEEHGGAHGQSRQLGGGNGQPDAVDAQHCNWSARTGLGYYRIRAEKWENVL